MMPALHFSAIVGAFILSIVGLSACTPPTSPTVLPPCERSIITVVDARGVPVASATVVYCPDRRKGVRDTVTRPVAGLLS